MNLNTIDFQYILMGLLSFIIAGSLHEFGHASAAYLLGDTTARENGRMTLNPLAHLDIWGTIFFPLFSAISHFPVLGWMKPVPVNPRNFRDPSKGHAICAFAGPFSNLLQASFIIIIIKLMIMAAEPLRLADNMIFSGIITFFIRYFEINIYLMVFNLLPFPPLDGGWILRHFLPDSLKEQYDRFSRFGIIILYILILTRVLRAIFIPVITGVGNIFSYLIKSNILITILPFTVLALIVLYFFRDELGPVFRQFRNRSTLHILKGEEKDMAFETPEPVTKDPALKIYADEYEKDRLARLAWQTCDKTVFNKQRTVCIKCDKYISCLSRSIRDSIR